MKKWEYSIRFLSEEDEDYVVEQHMNVMGESGWELVTSSRTDYKEYTRCIFKRELYDSDETIAPEESGKTPPHMRQITRGVWGPSNR